MNATQHRLAAVVFVDVVGFSRMVAADEEGTLAALRAHRNETDPVVLNHGGRVVKGTGDGLLAEFPSATAALRAAVEVQELMRARNDALPDSRRMHLRVGIHLAEVVVDEAGDIHGNGVNVAARVEALAPPGGVAVTDAVRVAVRANVGAEFADGGVHRLKNIPDPVRIWTVGSVPSPAPAAAPATATPRTVATIAVLPFENMSNDADQDYFADGITEDLLTALSHDRDLAVVSRNSAFAYRNSGTDVRTIARELDATHVVEGSVRRSGDRVRVTAQLVDAETGHHVWADRYDRELDDVFALQDELVGAIAGRLRPSLWAEAGERLVGRDVTSVDAWDLYLRGQHAYRRHSTEGFLEALELLGQARELEPDFAAPVMVSASSWLLLAFNGWRQDGIDPWARGVADAAEAYRLDPDDYEVLAMAAGAAMVTGRPDEAVRLARRAVDVNPHGFLGHHMLGASLSAAGRPGDALEPLTQAWRLGRHEPFRYDIANDLMWAHYLTDNDPAALSWGQRALQLNADYLQVHLGLAATYAQLDDRDGAQPHVDRIMDVRPGFTIAKHRGHIVYRDEGHRDRVTAGLRLAGLPA